MNQSSGLSLLVLSTAIIGTISSCQCDKRDVTSFQRSVPYGSGDLRAKDEECRRELDQADLVIELISYTQISVLKPKRREPIPITPAGYQTLQEVIKVFKVSRARTVVIVVPEYEPLQSTVPRGKEVVHELEGFLRKSGFTHFYYQTFHHAGFYMHVFPDSWKYPDQPDQLK